MRKLFNLILTIATAALMISFAFFKINDVTHTIDLTPYLSYVNFAKNYMPIILLCLFAFGGILGKSVKIVLFIIIILALIIFAIACFLPDFIAKIFGTGGAEAIISLFKLTF